MELAEMIQRAEADLRTAEADVDVTHADVDRAQAALAAARDRHASMRATLNWLRQLGDQPEEDDQAKTPEPVLDAEPVLVEERFGKPVPAVTQSDRCLQALERLGRPSTTTEIRENLAHQGYVYDQSQVRSAMKYLARKRSALVENPRTGMWRLTRADARDPALNGSGGGP